ncbi:MAG: hypothetical protein M4579_001914 [Chaenotheca gracillima]|nr:MAG: hypothetical protein M4579_001914 [Chaenotheca gracillima]
MSRFTRVASFCTPLSRSSHGPRLTCVAPWTACNVGRWLSSTSANPPSTSTTSPLYFETGVGVIAKRSSRPFPPPFISPPSGSFSEPLSTHNRSRDRRPSVNGEFLRGITNGDDAVVACETFIGANDGVGAWASRPRGHAALWSRLILHFWALEVENYNKLENPTEPDPVEWLQRAYELTKTATSNPTEWNGTTTACGALLYFSPNDGNTNNTLYVTNLGDGKVLVIRPRDKSVLYRTAEQWHWFDCPRQLGTNSPDTPRQNAVMEKVPVEDGDIVLAMSDGVMDNLWEHEVLENVLNSLTKMDPDATKTLEASDGTLGNRMDIVAKDLVWAAKVIAQDPFAESPFMERAVDEGLAMEGGETNSSTVNSILITLTSELQANPMISAQSSLYANAAQAE